MALIDGVRSACDALAQQGWGELLLAVTGGALDITAPDLDAELSKTLPAIDRSLPGFEDFCAAGQRAIEPGQPARSLLYHALASPCVRGSDRAPVSGYPTLAQIEAVENYVYGAVSPTLAQLASGAGAGELVVAVFAVEYRPGARTPHGSYADLCCSRTGIARVGTTTASYDAPGRQFEPLDPDDPYAFRVLPVRYAPFIAVASQGPGEGMPAGPGDQQRRFLVPVQKLFSGTECIAGMNLTVTLAAEHVNEKLGRMHAVLQSLGYATGWSGPVLEQPPFRFSDRLAELSTDPAHGLGLLVPTVHPHLVEPAMYEGKPLAMQVPKDLKSTSTPPSTALARYFSGLEIAPAGPMPPHGHGQTLIPAGKSHPAPEIINARHQLLADGSEVNLNDEPKVWDIVAAGGYSARHFLDFTGDGWVEVACPELNGLIDSRDAAYSLICGPDFFPYCDQLELMQWWPSVPAPMREGLWAVLPRALSDTRLPANLNLSGSGFDPSDSTITAIVCPPGVAAAAAGPAPEPAIRLRSSLPDGAGGVFDPGWDVTTDTPGADPPPPPGAPVPPGVPPAADTLFLTAYGLGTPFVEDAKICAALGTYWPAVAPDATRTFQPDKYWPTISPLTDEEIGIVGSMPWDGIKGPIRLPAHDGKPAVVEYTDIDYADYVDQALAGKLSAKLTARIDFEQYTQRVLAMAAIYWGLGIRFPPELNSKGHKVSYFQRIQNFLQAKARWNVLEFRVVEPGGGDAALFEAATKTSGVARTGDGPIFWSALYRAGHTRQSPDSFRKVHVDIAEEVHAFTDLVHVYMLREGGEWAAQAIPTS